MSDHLPDPVTCDRCHEAMDGVAEVLVDGLCPWCRNPEAPEADPHEHARDILRPLRYGDAWTPTCDAAAAVLGIDPDNYRARDSDYWPADIRGCVTFDSGESILAHADKLQAGGVR